MKQLLFLMILLFISPVVAPASELVKVTRVDNRENIQVYFSFDKAPQYSTVANQRRIDLVFKDTTASSNLSFFPPDEHIVKILPHSGKSAFSVSLFFRYQPQSQKLTKSQDGKVVLEVQPGNELSNTRQELAKRLKGITVVDRAPVDQTNPAILSPYAKNWTLFFTAFETPIEIALPVAYTPPPFPIVQLLPPHKDLNLQILDDDILELANKERWALVQEKLVALIQATSDREYQKILALTLGEALFRQGEFEKAYTQLHLLKEKYADELIGTYANYLLILLRAAHESPNLADADFQALEGAVGNSPLAPYFLLSQIETALATGQTKRLGKLLQKDDVAFPKSIVERVRIHQADYWYALKQPIKAFAAYQFYKNSPALSSSPYSLGGYCATLYTQKKFKEAAACYDRLGAIVSDKPLLGLVEYRKNMAKLKFSEGNSLIDEFARIAKAYPDTEAAVRATMKKNDLTYLQSKDQAMQVIESYESIAENSSVRSIREESMFKTALVQAEAGKQSASISLLQQVLREFHMGDVRISAQALLIQLLPGEIKRLVENNEYVAALVLAKQNKDLFEKKWIDHQFLAETALAYHHVGLYNEAYKLYLYLMEVLPAEEREKYYLPMVQAAFDQGDYNLVEDYAAQYSYNYPKGKYASPLLILQLNALLNDDKVTEAMKLLPSPLPEDKELYKIAAAIYFRLNDFSKCLMTLEKLIGKEHPLPQKEQFFLSESLYATGAFDEAEKSYRMISKENEFYDQSLFRLASLERRKGNEEKALSFFREIVEKGSNPRWKQYAERELQFKSVTGRR